MSEASATRRCSPPESETTKRFSYSFSLNSCKMRSILSSKFHALWWSRKAVIFSSLASSSLFLKSLATSRLSLACSSCAVLSSTSSFKMASLTVRLASKWGCCASISTCRLAFTTRLPSVGSSVPKAIFISVDLPQPFCPTIAIRSPALR